MDFNIILLTGSICFVCTALLKLIMKKAVVNMKANISDRSIAAFVYIMLFIFCFMVYVFILYRIGNRHFFIWHFKLCYVIKAWTVAVSLNAVYEHLVLGLNPWSRF